MSLENQNTVPIKRVSFQVLTNRQTKRMSVVSKEINGINQTDMFTDGQVTRGGLLDLRLGTTDPNSGCATCGQIPSECPGHFGHTDLAEPVFHFGYLDIVKNILSCICLRCSKLLIYKNEDELSELLTNTKKGKNRFAEIKKLTSGVTYCARTDQNCGVPVPKIKKDVKKSSGIIQLVAETSLQNIANEDGTQVSAADKKKKIREVLTPRMVYDILKNVSDNDYKIMGFDPSICRGEDFIIKNFPIPPIAIRPSVKMSISSTTNYEDMLTGKLVDIIKANMRIRKQIDKESTSGEEPKYLNDNVQLLQYHIATYFDNENMNLPKSEQKSGGRPTKSISDRIRGKTGRIRGNLMGKRTDFSARTVITSDPNLSLDDLGVPIKIAMNITFPEVVTPYNIDEMTKLVKNGRYVYPGANFVIPGSSNDGKKYTIDLRYRKKGIKLRPGDIVERHIHDGDPVLFNRQPSLHKLSMMCHKVKVINDDRLATFRINVSVTTPYNADFDGDEMNMFVPQSVQTQLELAHIADVSKQIITPRYSKPIIKLKQDTVLGSFQMTEKKYDVDWHDAMNILMNCKNIDFTKIKKQNIDTHQLYSAIIPPLINIVNGDKLEINNGNLIKGTISGSVINDNIINFSWDRHGPKITKDFIDNSQKLVINYLLQDGFTVGLGDAIIPKDDQLEIKKYMQEKVLEIQHLLTEIENYPDLLDAQTFEKQVFSILSAGKGELSKMVMKKLNSDNHFYGMIASKAKGNDINLGQIVGGLAQDILKFARIEKKVNNRTLVHFCQHDDTAEARGFITKSYYDGLEPHEFYFHHMAGREGLIDTAIKSVTGDTELIIIENGNSKHVKIGEWIDGLLENNQNIKIDNDNNEYREEIKLNKNVLISTTDLDGKVSWGQITGITRHLPSQYMYEIETHGGRKVTVTDSHSLLVWNKNTKQLERLKPELIEIGSFVPVTAKLPKTPLINNFIDLKELFPKNEYIHGSDFIKAKNMVNETMQGRQRMPAGWWDEHNGNEFTLPYNKMQLFQRTLWRSNNDMITEDCIYSYGTNKSDSTIYDKFEFTPDNGLLLGLYIAEGNSDIPSGYVQITNNDEVILTFVKNWFDKHNIKWNIKTKINHISGKSTCIRGYSVLLAKIFHNIAGHGARNKFIHPQCFSAPIDFIKSLVNGIISGDGTVTNNSIQIGSSSFRLIQDLSFCLNRLNIFGKITITKMQKNNLGTENMADINMLSIRAQWAIKFKEQISLICNYKQEKLNNIEPSEEHRNFDEHNDIVLDKIIKINKINGSNFNKVYDLTVPSTLNFGLANGLHVVDTADTGYLQRKLIKGMEDVYIAYDGTVRSGNNVIIQMLFGDSHLDQTMQKPVKFNILSWGNSNIIEKCQFTENEINEISSKLKYDAKKKKEFKELNDEIVDIVKQFRDDLRDIQARAKLNSITINDIYFQAANYSRIIDDAKNTMSMDNTPLDPLYVISEIERLMDPTVCRLICVTNNDINEDSPKHYNQKKAKYLFQIALYEYLGPKRCIYEYKFNNEKFNLVISEIIKSFNNSTVEPGEMVGVVTSQSLGEPLTQMTLNTFHSTGSGVAGMQGVPRFRELLSYTKNPSTPYMIIYMDPEFRDNKEHAYRIGSTLKYTILSELAEQLDIIYDPDSKSNPISYYNIDDIDRDSVFFLNNMSSASIDNLPWLFRVGISKESMVENEISMLDIKTKFIQYWSNNFSDLSSLKKHEKDVITKILHGCIMTSFDSSDNLVIHIRFELSNVDNTILLSLQDILLNKFNIKGNSKISKISKIDHQQYVSFDNPNSDPENRKEWAIYTDGIDMFQIRKFLGVDINRTYCNDIYTIYQAFGIEAARFALIKEFENVFVGNDLNYAHIALLGDVMTNNGGITSIDRHGINRLDTDPMGRASFEKTIEQLLLAAAFNEVDYLRGVSSRIMVGRCIKGGTGLCDIKIDTEMLENSELVDTKEVKQYGSEFKTLKTNNLLSDLIKIKSKTFVPI